MGGASADRDVSGDDDIEYEPPPAAWQLTLDEATATHTLDVDWEAVHKAVQEWNNDGVARRWSDKAVTLMDPGDEQFKQRVEKRYDNFLRALVMYLNTYWTFISDLAVPMIIQRFWQTVNDGEIVADVVKQEEKGFTSKVQNRVANIMQPAPETGKLTSERRIIASLWLKSPYRNDKRMIIFHPKSTSDSHFNMWTGFACTREKEARDAAARHAGAAPQLVWQHCQVDQMRSQVEVPAVSWQEEAKLFTNHIEQIWCQGDEVLSNYVLDWLAHLLQFPEIKMGVALLVRGDHGAGKGIITALMREIIGRAHFSNFVNLSQLTGQYNGEFLERCILAIVDEVQSHKEDMSKVKSFITEKTHTVEQKYIAPYEIDSFANFIFLSNSDHMMKIEAGERRFLALEVSGRYAGAETDESRRYFEKLLALGANGRASSVAHFLYTRDLSKFRPRSLPETAATMMQKLQSMTSVQTWWITCLREGAVPCADSFNGAANSPQEHPTQWTL